MVAICDTDTNAIMQPQTKKKVLFLITKSNWGGAQRYVYDLATTLDQTVYEPVVALGGNGELTEKLSQAGIRTIALATLQRDVSISGITNLVALDIQKPQIPDTYRAHRNPTFEFTNEGALFRINANTPECEPSLR